jgi:hypothetical protein
LSGQNILVKRDNIIEKERREILYKFINLCIEIKNQTEQTLIKNINFEFKKKKKVKKKSILLKFIINKI